MATLDNRDIQEFGKAVGVVATSGLEKLYAGTMTQDEAINAVLVSMRTAVNTIQGAQKSDAAVQPAQEAPKVTEAQRLRSHPGYGALLDAGYYFDGNIGITDQWSQAGELQLVEDRVKYLSHGFEAETTIAYYPATGEVLPDFHGYFLRPVPSKMQPDKKEAWMAEYVRKITSQGGTPIQFGIDNER